MGQFDKLYNTQSWRMVRYRFLQQHPVCVFCLQQGRVEPATVADHVIPHRGDVGLFKDPSNLQALCSTCHSAAKQAQERSGLLRGCDAKGIPLDQINHPWFREERAGDE